MSDDRITDDEIHQRFVLDGDPERGHLAYSIRTDHMTLVHAEVTPSLRGQGIAGELVRAAVDRAIRENLTIVPACPYVRAWLQRNPDVGATVDVEWPPRRRLAG